MTTAYRLDDSPRIVSVDLPEDPDDLQRYAWRLANVAWEEMRESLKRTTEEALCRDGFHSLLLHCLYQMRDDGIEVVMNDRENQEPGS